jgi:hypothetical protein
MLFIGIPYSNERRGRMLPSCRTDIAVFTKSPEFLAAVASYVALTYGMAIPADTRCWTQGPVLEARPSH